MSDYRLIQDGQPVAWANSVSEIAHYALIYGQDGPVKVQRKINSRWRDNISALKSPKPQEATMSEGVGG